VVGAGRSERGFVMTIIDVEELDDEHEQRRDFRRANGAPLVSDPENPAKSLRYSRPSSYAKCLDDEEALVNWRIWKAMDGVARSKALQTQIVATHDEDKSEKKTLREKAMDKGSANERADQGTGLHAMTVRAEDQLDVDFHPPEQIQADLDAYREALASYGLVSEMTEVHMVNDHFRAAGTADRIFRCTRRLQAPFGVIEEGDLICGDLKTGAKLDFSMPGNAVQVALYATGQLYDIHTERRLATPPVRQDWGLLLHLPVGKAHCDVLWVDLNVGLFGAALAKEVKEWRRKWKNGTHDCPPVAPPSADPVEALVLAFPGAELVETSLEHMATYAQDRITTIGQSDRAKATLIARWPEGLPTPRKGLTSWEQVETLLKLLDDVEAEYSIPFMHRDPRISEGHKSNR